MSYICWTLFLIIITSDYYPLLTLQGSTITTIFKHNIIILTWWKPEMTLGKFSAFQYPTWFTFFFVQYLEHIHWFTKKNYNKVSCFSRISLWWKPPYGEKNQLMKVHLNHCWTYFSSTSSYNVAIIPRCYES